MKLHLEDGLPFVSASLVYQGQPLSLVNVLLDTGSAGTILAAERVLTIGLRYEPEDGVHRIQGVGGSEFVFSKRVDSLIIGELETIAFTIDIGAMDYGFEIDSIVGMDFLLAVGAVVDLATLTIRRGEVGKA